MKKFVLFVLLAVFSSVSLNVVAATDTLKCSDFLEVKNRRAAQSKSSSKSDPETQWKTMLGDVYDKYKGQGATVEMLMQALLPSVFRDSYLFNKDRIAQIPQNASYFDFPNLSKFTATTVMNLLSKYPELKQFSPYFSTPTAYAFFITSLKMLNITEIVVSLLAQKNGSHYKQIGTTKAFEALQFINDIFLSLSINKDKDIIMLKEGETNAPIVFKWVDKDGNTVDLQLKLWNKVADYNNQNSNTTIFAARYIPILGLLRIIRSEQHLHIDSDWSLEKALIHSSAVTETQLYSGFFDKPRNQISRSSDGESTLDQTLPPGHYRVVFIGRISDRISSTRYTDFKENNSSRSLDSGTDGYMDVQSIGVYSLSGKKVAILNNLPTITFEQIVEKLQIIGFAKDDIQRWDFIDLRWSTHSDVFKK